MSSRPVSLQQYFDKGTQAMSHRDYEGAAAWFAALLEIAPKDKEALEFYEKCRMLHAQKKMNFFSKIGYKIIGELFYALGMKKAALHYLGTLSVGAPHNPYLAAKYGNALAATGQVALASLAFKRALKFLPNNKSILKSAGPVFEAIDDKPTAIEVYAALQKMEPLDGRWPLKVKDLSAEHYGKTGGITDLTEQRKELERRALEDQSSSAKEERIKELLAEYTENPDEKIGLLAEIGRLLMQIDGYDKALPIWNRLAEKDEKFREEAQVGIATCYQKMGNLDKAEECYRTLLEAYPASQQYCEGYYGVRLQKLNEQIASHPEDISLIQQKELLEKEFLDRKVKMYAELVEKRAGDVDLQMTYGKLLTEAGNLEEAIRVFQKASNNPARSYPALRQLAWLFLRKGQVPLAIDSFKRALEKAPHSRNPTDEIKDIWYGLGEAYMRLDDKPNAREWYKRIYECDIDFRDVKSKYESLVA